MDWAASQWGETGHVFSYRSSNCYGLDKEAIQDFKYIDIFWESHSAQSGAADKLLPGFAGGSSFIGSNERKMLVK